jgi:hypothetical protein
MILSFITKSQAIKVNLLCFFLFTFKGVHMIRSIQYVIVLHICSVVLDSNRQRNKEETS